MLKKIYEGLFTNKKSISGDSSDDVEAGYMTREKILVFGISFFLAFCLWFIVNLSRDFSITIDLPVTIGNLPEEMALVDDPPALASVGVSGEGWNLIALYNNPPGITVDVEEQDVNLFEKIQQQISAISDVNVTTVQPMRLNLEMEEKASRQVPVEVIMEMQVRDRYGLVGEPVVSPDSVTITGARSRVEGIDIINTQETVLEDVSRSQELELQVETPSSAISVVPGRVTYSFEVAEFTEGEVSIPIRIRNLPPGQAVSYNPSSLTVRYGVPIDQYAEVQNTRPFEAYIDYSTIEQDTTGLLIPQVERIEDDYDVRLRSFSPRTISYFNVLNEETEEE